jgi:hypothetical protein
VAELERKLGGGGQAHIRKYNNMIIYSIFLKHTVASYDCISQLYNDNTQNKIVCKSDQNILKKCIFHPSSIVKV